KIPAAERKGRAVQAVDSQVPQKLQNREGPEAPSQVDRFLKETGSDPGVGESGRRAKQQQRGAVGQVEIAPILQPAHPIGVGSNPGCPRNFAPADSAGNPDVKRGGSPPRMDPCPGEILEQTRKFTSDLAGAALDVERDVVKVVERRGDAGQPPLKG